MKNTQLRTVTTNLIHKNVFTIIIRENKFLVKMNRRSHKVAINPAKFISKFYSLFKRSEYMFYFSNNLSKYKQILIIFSLSEQEMYEA